MRRLLLALLFALTTVLGTAGSSMAHQAPCEDLGPGHSTFARHHVVPLAQGGMLGAGGHTPGEHKGYAGLCGALAR